MLQFLFSVDVEKIAEQKEQLKEVLLDVKENVEKDDFINAEDFYEYKGLVKKFLTKINVSDK